MDRGRNAAGYRNDKCHRAGWRKMSRDTVTGFFDNSREGKKKTRSSLSIGTGKTKRESDRGEAGLSAVPAGATTREACSDAR